jgi:hypothetical protein
VKRFGVEVPSPPLCGAGTHRLKMRASYRRSSRSSTNVWCRAGTRGTASRHAPPRHDHVKSLTTVSGVFSARFACTRADTRPGFSHSGGRSERRRADMHVSAQRCTHARPVGDEAGKKASSGEALGHSNGIYKRNRHSSQNHVHERAWGPQAGKRRVENLRDSRGPLRSRNAPRAGAAGSQRHGPAEGAHLPRRFSAPAEKPLLLAGAERRSRGPGARDEASFRFD